MADVQARVHRSHGDVQVEEEWQGQAHAEGVAITTCTPRAAVTPWHESAGSAISCQPALKGVHEYRVGLFNPAPPPQAHPEEWTREDVQQWLGHLGFDRYDDAFRPIQVCRP